MSRTRMEIDFFAKENAAVRSACSDGDEGFRSARGIDLGAISCINPWLLRQLNSSSATATAAQRQIPPPANWLLPAVPSVPVFDPNSRSADSASSATAPLTIFYKGTVAVFDLSKEKAEELIKLAAESNVAHGDGGTVMAQDLVAKFNKQPLPIARKKSLQRFLEKRKERLTASSELPRKAEEVSWAG